MGDSGVTCPACGCSYSRVIRTRGIVSGIARRRRCDDCDIVYLTHERAASLPAIVTVAAEEADVAECN